MLVFFSLCSVWVRFVIVMYGIVLVVLFVILVVVVFSLIVWLCGVIIVCVLVELVICRYVLRLCGLVMLLSMSSSVGLLMLLSSLDRFCVSGMFLMCVMMFW